MNAMEILAYVTTIMDTSLWCFKSVNLLRFDQTLESEGPILSRAGRPTLRYEDKFCNHCAD